jgi:hypothetical protein
MPRLEVSPSIWPEGDEAEFDMFICALGYERRSRYIAETLSPRAEVKCAIGFTHNRILNYSDNLVWFDQAGFLIVEPSDSEFEHTFSDTIRRKISDENIELFICIDISSFSRLRIAIILSVLERSGEERRLRVKFLYSGAEFSQPPTEFGLNVSSGPVTERFAGWSTDPDKPPAAIVGLGYEKDKAVGAVEYLEPAEVWVFAATDHESEYSVAIREANAALLDSLPAARMGTYQLYSPYDCFKKLESLAYGTLRTRRPVMLPFGPKLFMLSCLLVALIHPDVAVWRFSSGDFETPLNRIPNGRIAGLDVRLLPCEDKAT